jgi:hypothetical protein
MVSLAGPIAQRLAGFPDKGDDDDAKNVGNCAGMLARIEAGLPMNPGPDEPRKLNPGDPLHTAAFRIIERAQVLRDNWLAVVRVAGALAKRDRLTQAELDHVIANVQRA